MDRIRPPTPSEGRPELARAHLPFAALIGAPPAGLLALGFLQRGGADVEVNKIKEINKINKVKTALTFDGA